MPYGHICSPGGTPSSHYASCPCQQTTFFTTSHPMTPYFGLYNQNFPAKSSIFKTFCKSQQKFEIAQILCNFIPNDSPLFVFLGSVAQWPTFFFARNLSLIAPWYDASVGAPPSILYASAPSSRHVAHDTPAH